VSLFPTRPVEELVVPATVPEHVASLHEVELAAEAVRQAWHLGLNAIPSLADTLEEHGLLVLTTGADETSKFDGLAATVGGVPVVVVGAAWPADRQRFTMAHELGHLVLAGRLAEGLDEEKACDRFAGAFLVPAESVVQELGARRHRLEPAELLALKHEYGLSMMAWIFRAHDAGVITDKTKGILFRLFSAKGWRKKEPGEPLAPEVLKLFERLVLRAHAEDMISTSKAAELMCTPLAHFRQRLSLEDSRGAAHQ
jgi:Zn-dependent peptidase ImmA (M78 family)